jgi:hypothetical protein
MGLSREARRLFFGIVLLAVVLAVLREPELAGDPRIYRSRMALLFDGQVPYVDFFFEHFPLAIAPMALAWLLGGAFDPVIYTFLFSLMMAVCLWATLILVERTGERLSIADAGMRWLTLAGPLFPIVLFRSDPFPVLFAMAGFYAMVFAKERMAIGMEVAGIATKGWPVVLALPEWWRGQRRRAVLLVVIALVLGGLLITLPGFSQARQFAGIHSETTVGAVFTLARIWSGFGLGLINEAGATYVAVPIWATVLNLGLGITLLILALVRVRGAFSWEGGVRLLSAALVALLVGFPLLSPQFILWPTPFLALHPDKTVRGTAIAVSALTLIYMLGWNSGFEGDLWWVGVVNLRNIVLVALGVMTAWRVVSSSTSSVAAERS